MPQSSQSVPSAHTLSVAPSPPSSHSPLPLCAHVLLHASNSGGARGNVGDGIGSGTGGGGALTRNPQSAQSVPNAHMLSVAPSPPSSHSPLPLCAQVLSHTSDNGEGGEGDGGGGKIEGGDPSRTWASPELAAMARARNIAWGVRVMSRLVPGAVMSVV